MTGARSWYSFQPVWIVFDPGARLQAYATEREAKRAAGPGVGVQAIPVWHEGDSAPKGDLKVVTPYDEPRKLWERIVFPSARLAYQQGFAARISATPDLADAIAGAFDTYTDRDVLLERVIHLAAERTARAEMDA